MANGLLILQQDIDKMITDLEYDKKEMERLRSDIDYMLEIDTITCNKKTLIDRLMRFSMYRSEKSLRKLRHRKFKHIRKAIEQNDDLYLINAVYNDTSLFELRQILADTRYDLRDLLNTPGSYLATGTIVDAFHFEEEQCKKLKDIVEEIKEYLNKNHIKTINLHN